MRYVGRQMETTAIGGTTIPTAGRSGISHEQAFLRWVAGLFDGVVDAPGPLWLDNGGRPYGEPQLYQETMEAVHQMWPRKLLEFLTLSGGWEKRTTLTGGKLREVRMWDHEEFDRLQLDSVGAVLHVFETVWEWSLRQWRISRQGALYVWGRPLQASVDQLTNRPQRSSSHGEQLLLFAVGLKTEGHREIFPFFHAQSGLLQLALRHEPLGEKQALEVSRVKDDLEAWSWTFPWIGHFVCERWGDLDRMKLQGLVTYRACLRALTSAICCVLDLVEGGLRSEALLPVMMFFRECYVEMDVEATAAALDARILNKDMARSRITEQQAERDRWAAFLSLTHRVRDLYLKSWRTPPILRTPEDEYRIALWRELEFGRVMEVIEALRAELEQELG